MATSKPEFLASPHNPLVKDVRRAIGRGALTSDGCCVAETFHLVEEALRSGREIRAVLTAESALSSVEHHFGELPGIRVAVLPDPLFQSVAATETSQGVMALVRPAEWALDQVLGGSLIVVLDGVQDPGNSGAIVRAAEAFGATGLVFLKGTVSPYNPKAVRASAGSLFRVPLVAGIEGRLARAALEKNGLDLYACLPAGSRDIAGADLTRRCAIVVGSEGRGVNEELWSGASGLRIPTTTVESLNAAMAAGIVLYEARRQRGERQ